MPTTDNGKNSRNHWEAQLRKGTLDMAALASVWHGRLYDWKSFVTSKPTRN